MVAPSTFQNSYQAGRSGAPTEIDQRSASPARRDKAPNLVAGSAYPEHGITPAQAAVLAVLANPNYEQTETAEA